MTDAHPELTAQCHGALLDPCDSDALAATRRRDSAHEEAPKVAAQFSTSPSRTQDCGYDLQPVTSADRYSQHGRGDTHRWT